MKGDFTRLFFDPATSGYTGVLKQQGRVSLDADWNEQLAIQDYLSRIQSSDVIGRCGVPKTGGGFAVSLSADGADLQISDGRIYVSGLLCRLDAPISYLMQSHLPDPPALAPQADQTDLVFLDVWQRHVTAVEDPSLQEPALGGPDTTTRLQVIWQVRVQRVAFGTRCDTLGDWEPATSGGLLSTGVSTADLSEDPCDLTPTGGFRGLENQLYRIEIHDGGEIGAATFKWSRDNGSVVFAVEEFMDGQPTDRLKLRSLGRDRVLSLHVDDWVEILDDTMDLSGTPGIIARIAEPPDETSRVITLDRTIDGLDPNRHPRVRRWDHGAETEAIVVASGAMELEHGVEVTFAGGNFQTGDYWSFAARTATADVERLTDQPPFGIRHFYCPLALVTWRPGAGEGTWTADIEDCRGRFPPLTDICADDICIDNDVCALPGAETVQDAIDILCKRNDLPFHNKHLHGWGIVCGLQVICGPDDDGERRRHVTVRHGYALDCEGNDIMLQQDQPIDVIEMIRRFEEENHDSPLLDEQGNGDVCLILNSDRQQPFSIEPHDPSRDNSMRSLLAGTLLMNFYNDCIKRLVDFFRDEFTVPNEKQDRPVGPVQERVSVFTNLIAQPVNPTTGQYIFISPREHAIMRDFYRRLRALLQSHTYCAMFNNAREFPEDYPQGLREAGMDTVFGKSFHTRLRARPKSGEVYSVGGGLHPLKPSRAINRYRVAGAMAERRLLSQIDPLAGTEGATAATESGAGAVQDVAFSQDGRRIFVIVSSHDQENTFFRAGKFSGTGIRWDPAVTICGVKLVTLATTPADPNHVYAVGQQQVITQNANGNQIVEHKGGLYRIDPNNVDPDIKPLNEFNPVGHLRISDDGRAFATAAAADTAPTRYDRIIAVNVPTGDSIFDGPLMLDATGRDDIAILTGRDIEVLYVVLGPQQGRKRIAAYDLRRGTELRISAPMADTDLRLETLASTGALLVASADGYALLLVDIEDNTLDEEYLLPMQVGPSALVASPEGKAVYVLNAGSNTITTVDDLRAVVPGYRYPLDELARYRATVLNAFTDLLAGLLQYLKDCLCDHFLVNCPECDEEDKIYLGCISIRENQVQRVCNFSKRKYVKSFPTVDYWLSLFPIVPLIDRFVEQFCCTALPEIFGRFTTAPSQTKYSAAYQPRVATGSFFTAAAALRSLGLSSNLRQFQIKGRQAGALARDRLRASAVAQPQRAGAVRLSVDEPVESVEARLAKEGIEVTRAPYDPTRIKSLTSIFHTPQPGSEVTLYEEQGRVKYYEIRQPAAVAAAPASAGAAELRVQIQELSAALSARNTELEEVRRQLRTLSDKQTALEEAAPADIGDLRAELEELRAFRAEVIRFMRDSRGEP